MYCTYTNEGGVRLGVRPPLVDKVSASLSEVLHVDEEVEVCYRMEVCYRDVPESGSKLAFRREET